MSELEFQLAHAPIVEAVLDIDCDMPTDFDLAGLETTAQDKFHAQYPKSRRQYRQHHQIQRKAEETKVQSTEPALHALRFLQEDEKQLVQIRTQGFSFNRLTPYSSLDDYLPEIRRTWELYIGLVKPIQTRAIRLRYINRILLPSKDSCIEINDYIKIGPRLPDENHLWMGSFVNQYTAIEKETEHEVVIVLSSQPWEDDKFPVIFDNGASGMIVTEPDDWSALLAVIQSLRRLKNRIFQETLTPICLDLFR